MSVGSIRATGRRRVIGPAIAVALVALGVLMLFLWPVRPHQVVLPEGVPWRPLVLAPGQSATVAVRPILPGLSEVWIRLFDPIGPGDLSGEFDPVNGGPTIPIAAEPLTRGEVHYARFRLNQGAAVADPPRRLKLTIPAGNNAPIRLAEANGRFDPAAVPGETANLGYELTYETTAAQVGLTVAGRLGELTGTRWAAPAVIGLAALGALGAFGRLVWLTGRPTVRPS